MSQSIGRGELHLAAAALVLAAVPGPAVAADREAAAEAASGFAAIDGARLYYEVAGKGAPVVLLHGNAGDHRHWDLQVPALTREFRVIRYDARGYGRSSLPEESAPYADHEDLAALLDKLGVARAHLVGWSMGAATAIDFAIRFPDRTLSVTAIGPWVAGYTSATTNEVFEGFAGVAAAARQHGREAALQAFMDAPFFAATSRDSPARSGFQLIGADYSFWAFAHRDPRWTLTPPAAGRLAEVRAPMLILAGEHDIPACLEISTLLDERVGDSTQIVVPGSGHLLHMERAEDVNAHLVKFLRAAQPRAATTDGLIPAGPFELRYQIEGRGHPTIVIGSPIYYSRVFSPTLRDRLQLVFLDHRAFARQTRAAEPKDYTLDVVLDDIERARRFLKLDHIVVIGHSGQAYMALEYAKKHPAHVSHVVMIGIAPNLSAAGAAAAEKYWLDIASPERKALLEERRRSVPDSELARLDPGPRFIQTYGVRDSPRSWYRLDFDPAPLWRGVEMNMDVFNHLWGEVFRDLDITRGLDALHLPVFVAPGRHDFVVAPPSSWDPVAREFHDVTVRIFEHSGHTPQYEEAELFDAELLKWLDDHP
jgi:proline iminopeptidase